MSDKKDITYSVRINDRIKFEIDQLNTEQRAILAGKVRVAICNYLHSVTVDYSKYGLHEFKDSEYAS